MPTSPVEPTARLSKNSCITIKQVVIRITLIIALAEFLVMLVLRAIPHEAGTFSEALFDATSLAVLSIPLIYMWVIKPFVNARDKALAQLSHLAHVDPLTGLANRRSLSNDLEKAVASSARHKDHGAVFLIDLDGFKLINDRYGHEVGDAVLVKTAEHLQAIARSEDIVSRLGGDEFVVLIHRLGADESVAREKALRIAEKLINAVTVPLEFNGKKLHVTASIGICILGSEKLDTETAIREADIAMYRAKQAGGGMCSFFRAMKIKEP